MVTDRLLALQELDTAIDRASARRALLEGGEAVTDARSQADAAERRLGEFRLRLDEVSRDQAAEVWEGPLTLAEEGLVLEVG